MDAQGNTTGLSHLGGVTEKPKAGDIGGGMKGKVDRELGGIAVEEFHPGDGISEFIGGGETAFESGGNDAGAKRLGEKEAVTGTQTSFGENLVILDDAEGYQSKLWFVILDRVSACDDNTCFECLFGGTAHDCLRDIHGQRGREGRNVEGEERSSAH